MRISIYEYIISYNNINDIISLMVVFYAFQKSWK